MLSRKATVLISVTILVIATSVYLVLFTSPYISVSEVVTNSGSYVGTYVRVMGNVSRTVFVNESDGSITFILTDGKASIAVRYRKTLPSTWRDDLPIVVAGTLVNDELIEADQIITQCPSRYVP